MVQDFVYPRNTVKRDGLIMRRLFSYLCLLVFLGIVVCPAQPWAQTHTERIAVVVNQDAISLSDVTARTQLIMISSGMPQSSEMGRNCRFR